jgi:hypothetical protein
MLNRLALTRTLLAMRLHLLEQARRKLMLLYPDAAPTTKITRLNMSILRSRPLTRRANRLLLNRKLRLAPVVKVAQRNRNTHFHVGTPPLAAVVPEVAWAAEEAAEEVEGVVVLAGPAALLVLRDALVAVLVVDFAGFFVAEDVVGVGYFDEFLGGGFVATGFIVLDVFRGLGGLGWEVDVRVLVWVVFLAEVSVGFLDLAVGGIFLEAE